MVVSRWDGGSSSPTQPGLEAQSSAATLSFKYSCTVSVIKGTHTHTVMALLVANSLLFFVFAADIVCNLVLLILHFFIALLSLGTVKLSFCLIPNIQKKTDWTSCKKQQKNKVVYE